MTLTAEKRVTRNASIAPLPHARVLQFAKLKCSHDHMSVWKITFPFGPARIAIKRRWARMDFNMARMDSKADILCIISICSTSWVRWILRPTGISSKIRTKLCDWAVWQARASCYTQAVLFINKRVNSLRDRQHCRCHMILNTNSKYLCLEHFQYLKPQSS